MIDSNLGCLVIVLAVARVTRLLAADFLLDRPRRWVQRHAGEQVAYLVGCPWCLSIWVGSAVVIAVAAWPSSTPLRVLLTALPASEVTGLISTHLDRWDSYGDDDQPEATG